MKSKNFLGHKKLVIIFGIIIITLIASFAFFAVGISAVDSENHKDITVEIKKGSGSYDIINALYDAKLIRSKTAAKIYVKFFGPDSLQANTYALTKAMSLSDMLNIINKGDAKYVVKSQFTIIEGVTYKDAAAAISEATGIDQGEIVAKWRDRTYLSSLIKKYWFLDESILEDGIICPLEGYLYPNTYFVTEKNPTVESVTELILKQTDLKLNGIKDEIKKSGKSVHEILTLSSIVENESLYKEDRSKIAGVFMNRLKKDMMLQSDITVLYALGEKRVDVSVVDTQVDSKYNTYLHTGLPVGPVSNPQLSTIKDTLNYDKNDYLYFFATKEGKVIYSKTYDEHLATVEKHGWY